MMIVSAVICNRAPVELIKPEPDTCTVLYEWLPCMLRVPLTFNVPELGQGAPEELPQPANVLVVITPAMPLVPAEPAAPVPEPAPPLPPEPGANDTVPWLL